MNAKAEPLLQRTRLSLRSLGIPLRCFRLLCGVLRCLIVEQRHLLLMHLLLGRVSRYLLHFLADLILLGQAASLLTRPFRDDLLSIRFAPGLIRARGVESASSRKKIGR